MAHKSKSTKMIEDMIHSFEWAAKRARSEKMIRKDEEEAEDDE